MVAQPSTKALAPVVFSRAEFRWIVIPVTAAFFVALVVLIAGDISMSLDSRPGARAIYGITPGMASIFHTLVLAALVFQLAQMRRQGRYIVRPATSSKAHS